MNTGNILIICLLGIKGISLLLWIIIRIYKKRKKIKANRQVNEKAGSDEFKVNINL